MGNLNCVATDEESVEVGQAHALGITPEVVYATSLEEADSEALRAEIQRREAMDSFTITCKLPET